MPSIIGSLRGVLSLDSAAFDTGVKRALAGMDGMERRVAQVSTKIARSGRAMQLAITAPMAAAATAAVRSSLRTIDAQAKMAQSLGTTVRSMQVLDRAADLSGVSIGQMEQATKQLTKRLGEAAATGKGPAAEALKILRLNARALAAEPLDARIADIGRALADYVPEAQRAAVAARLFGDEAGVVFTRIDTETLRIATQDVTRFGIAVTEVQADQIERTNDAISRLGLVSRGMANQLTAAVAPALESLAGQVARLGDWFSSLSDSGKRWTAGLAALAVAAGPVAIAIGGIGLAVVGLGTAAAALLGPLTLAGAAVAAVGVAAAAALLDQGRAEEIHQQVMDSVTRAMGDQIRQSDALAKALGEGKYRTLDVVEAKLLEEQARRAVVVQLVEERRQAVLTALGYDQIVARMRTVREQMDALRTPGDDLEQMPARLRDAYEEAEREMSTLLQRQKELLQNTRSWTGLTNEERRHLEQIEANLARLKARQAEINGETSATVTLGQRLSFTVDEAARRLGLAWQNATGLAGGLGQATAQAAALSGFLAGLPGDLAAATANIAGLKAGIAVLASGGTEAAASVAKYRAQLEATLPPFAAMQDGERDYVRDRIDAKVALFALEQALTAEFQEGIAALAKTGGAAKAASKSAIDGIVAEIARRRELLGMTEDQRRQYEAVIAVQQRLGDEAAKVGAAQVRSLADQVVALDAAEEAMQRVADQQRQWSENITRTAFEGGSLSDTIEGMLRDIAYQFAHTKIVLPIVANVTSILGLDALLAGGAATGAAGGSGNGLLGGLLGGKLLGGVFGGVGSGLSAALGTGGFASAGLFKIGANAATAVAAGAGQISATLGAALPAIGLIGGALALLAKAFSRKYAGSAIRGTLDPEGFEGTQFDFYKGGFLAGDKAVYAPVATEVQGLLDSAMKGLTTGLKGMAVSLGLATGALADFSGAEFTVWTNGKDAAQIQAELAEQIDAAGDNMAGLLLGTEKWTRAGETASGTLARLSTSIDTVNTILDTLGHRLYRVSLRGADAASSLADAFGGLDAMQAATATYWQAFYSEQERFDTQLRQLRERFADLGLAMPESRAAFRSMVEGLDLATDSGRTLYAELLGLSGALDEVLPQVARFTLSMAGLVTKLGTEIDARIAAAGDLARASAQAAGEWYRAADSLRDLVRDIDGTSLGGGTSREQMAANRSAYAAAVKASLGGDRTAAASVPALARAVLDGARATARSGDDYRFAAAQVRAQVSLLAGVAELQGSNEDVLRALYEEQIGVLQGLADLIAAGDLDGKALKAFNRNLTALGKVIEDVKGFSYADVLAKLDIAVGLADGTPPWLEKLAKKTGQDIRTTLDFVVRRNDLTPPMRWIAAQTATEHVKTLRFLVTRDLGDRTKKIAFDTESKLLKTLRFTVAKDLDDETKLLALAGDSDLTRGVIAALRRGKSDPEAMRLALGNIGAYTALVAAKLDKFGPKAARIVLDQQGAYAAMVHAAVTELDGTGRRVLLRQQGDYVARLSAAFADGLPAWKQRLLEQDETTALRKLTLDMTGIEGDPKKKALLDAITGASAGKITLGGVFTFAPTDAFKTWFADTTRAGIAAPMSRLSGMLDALRAAVVADTADRKAAAVRAAKLASLQEAGAKALATLDNRKAGAAGLVDQIKALEASTGIQLQDNDGKSPIEIGPDGKIVYRADYHTGGPGVAAFQKAFYGPNGLEAKIKLWNDRIGASNSVLEALRAQIRGLGAIPGFAAGGLHRGGLRMVGERGRELEATGPARIWSAEQTRAMLGGGRAADVAGLRRDVQSMANLMGQWLSQIESHTYDSKTALKRIDAIGVGARS